MDIEITLRNYRCFGDEPVSLRLRDGFTALVGMNNGGKSSLLRVPYELRNFFQNFRQAWNVLCGVDAGVFWSPLVLDGERLIRAGVTRPVEISITVHDGPKGPFKVEGALATCHFAWSGAGQRTTGSVTAGGATVPSTLLAAMSDLDSLFLAIEKLVRVIYIGPFRNAISTTAAQTYYDLQIGTGFVSAFTEYKSGNNPEHNEAVVALVEEVRRIFGYTALEISPTADGKNLQVVADGRSYRLSELGAGLAHFVVVLVNVLVKQPSILLIDEPELNLHAALQLDFLSALARYSENGVVFATHSLGLARSSADHISLVTRDTDGVGHVRPYEGHDDLPSIASQLGFDGRPELGFRKVLLVEGKTDVRAVMQLLRLYGKEHEIALVPLGGGELINSSSDVELRELQRLGPVSYLIDSERTAADAPPAEKHAAFAALCDKLKISGHMLERRALENYIPTSALESVFGGVAELAPYDKFTSSNGWAKTQTWRATAAMSKTDLDGTDLGAFLAEL